MTAKCRNDLTHLEGRPREQYDGGDLYWLAEGVFNITRLVLLLHVGLDPSLVPTLAASWPVHETSNRVRQVVDRLAGRSGK